MKTIAIMAGVAILVMFNVGCSTHAAVGPEGHQHGMATSVGKSGAHAKVY